MEVQLKSDEQQRQLQELNSYKTRTAAENADLTRQIEEAESQIAAVSRVKTQLGNQASFHVNTRQSATCKLKLLIASTQKKQKF